MLYDNKTTLGGVIGGAVMLLGVAASAPVAIAVATVARSLVELAPIFIQTAPIVPFLVKGATVVSFLGTMIGGVGAGGVVAEIVTSRIESSKKPPINHVSSNTALDVMIPALPLKGELRKSFSKTGDEYTLFRRTRTLNKLAELMEENKFEEFKDVYDNCSFDINKYRPANSSHSNLDLLGEAMLTNKPDFVQFLLEKIDKKEFSHVYGYSYSDEAYSKPMRTSMLAMAIENGMTPLALQLLNTPGTNINEGQEIKRLSWWDRLESPIEIATRHGNREVIDALVDKEMGSSKKQKKDLVTGTSAQDRENSNKVKTKNTLG